MKRISFIAVAAIFLAASRPALSYDFIEFLEPVAADFAKDPMAVKVGGDRFYLVDEKGGALYVFDLDGKLLETVKGSGLLSGPQGVAIGPDGSVFVADTRNSRVQVFDRDGKFLRTIGSRGSQPGLLSKPRSVAVGADGRVFVADTGNSRVQVFTGEGVFLFGFGEKGKETGQMRSPTRIAVDPSDNIYVLDEDNERLQKYDPLTKHLKDYSLHGQDFTVDDYGFIYMVDRKRGKVKELGPDGIVLGGFGSVGKGKGQFGKPEGISSAPDGTLYIVDAGNSRIQRVRLANKQKKSRLDPNLATKLLVTGPTRTMKVKSSVLGSGAGKLVAYVPKTGKFAVFDAEGKELQGFGTRKSDDEEVVTERAAGVLVSEKFGIYAADSEGHQIQLFGLDGTHKSNFGGTKGLFASRKKEGRVKEPSGLALNEKGSLYVADTGNARIGAYGPDGTFLFGFGPHIGPYELSEPVAVAWDQGGFVFVLDRKLKKVFKCEPSGGYINAWGGEGEGIGQFDDPVSMAYDGKTYLYVLDRGLKRVSVFNRNGEWVTNFFSGGDTDQSLSDPSSLTVMGSELIISDPRRERVVAFQVHPRLAPPVAVSTKAVEGEIVLNWDVLKDPWVKSYRVYRSENPFGPFQEIGTSEKPSFSDSGVEAYQKRHYRVAVEAATGDIGPVSRAVEVFVPGAFNRAPVEISTISIGNIFSANYKWYLKNPVGSVEIVNNVNLPFTNVKVSFRLRDFMDFATEKVIEKLGPKESAKVPLAATLNNRILEVSEDTPIQAEITITYFEKGKKQEVSQALPLKVYSRNAITWDDVKKIGAFITPKDPPVKDLANEVKRVAPEGAAGTEYLNGPLVEALQVWTALGSLGVKFVTSPNNPFEKVSEDPAFPVDYTQFPRETLRRRSGECDDLVTLISSMLEGIGGRAALLDYPGHLALMFDTGSGDPFEIGLPEDRLIKHGETYWIPLEATMIGKPFEDASSKALFAYRDMSKDGRAAVVDPRAAWEVFEPATLPNPDLEALKPLKGEFDRRFKESSAHFVKARHAFMTEHLKKKIAEAADEDKPALDLQLGILHAQHGKLDEAAKVFNAILAEEADNAAALNNLGSIHYTQGKFEAALESYGKAAGGDPADAGVWMNLVRTAVKMGKKEWAEDYSKKALAIDPSLKPDVDSLLKL